MYPRLRRSDAILLEEPSTTSSTGERQIAISTT
jgi:hypothetical protein